MLSALRSHTLSSTWRFMQRWDRSTPLVWLEVMLGNVPYLKHQPHHLPFHHYCETIRLPKKSSSQNSVKILIFFTIINLRKIDPDYTGVCTFWSAGICLSSIWSPYSSMHPISTTCSLKGKWFVSISSAVTTGLNPSLGITWSSRTGCQMPSKATEIDGDNFPHSSFMVYIVTFFHFNLSRD